MKFGNIDVSVLWFLALFPPPSFVSVGEKATAPVLWSVVFPITAPRPVPSGKHKRNITLFEHKL